MADIIQDKPVESSEKEAKERTLVINLWGTAEEEETAKQLGKN